MKGASEAKNRGDPNILRRARPRKREKSVEEKEDDRFEAAADIWCRIEKTIPGKNISKQGKMEKKAVDCAKSAKKDTMSKTIV